MPHEYVVSKFYELGFYPKFNKYNNTYQCCCPICREGKSFGKKKRCFYLPDRTQIFCHNCGEGWTPYNWISTVGNLTYDEIWKEIQEGDFDSVEELNLDEEPQKVIKNPSLPEDSINLFDPIQLTYWRNDEKVKRALEYIKERRLGTAKNRPDALYISLKDYTHKNRLVIPFKDEFGKIIFYQSRKLFEWDEHPNYISKVNADKSVFGFDKVSSDLDYVFIFEGPIDSCFVKNGTAIGGINPGNFTLTPKQQQQFNLIPFHTKIWCLDSQWLDETSRDKTSKLIEQGETVFIWPEKWGKKYKDLNEICAANKLDEISSKFIIENSHQGMAASIKYKMLLAKI